MRLREALREGVRRLAAAGVAAPELSAEILLMHALGCGRSALHAHPDREIPPEARARYFQFITERGTGKPVQYITGHQEFWGLDFKITPDVLIPRPETEHVVEAVLEIAAALPRTPESRLRIVDVGTGSGCIALALASELTQAEIFALDISPAALAVARGNAARLNPAHRVQFRDSDLLGSLLDEGRVGTFDFVVSNPPYVGVNDLGKVQLEVKEFEPRLAWGGLEREDEIYRRLFPEAARLLRKGGSVVVEIGYNLRERVEGLLGEEWERVETRPDLSGIPRVVTARKA